MLQHSAATFTACVMSWEGGRLDAGESTIDCVRAYTSVMSWEGERLDALP